MSNYIKKEMLITTLQSLVRTVDNLAELRFIVTDEVVWAKVLKGWKLEKFSHNSLMEMITYFSTWLEHWYGEENFSSYWYLMDLSGSKMAGTEDDQVKPD